MTRVPTIHRMSIGTLHLHAPILEIDYITMQAPTEKVSKYLKNIESKVGAVELISDCQQISNKSLTYAVIVAFLGELGPDSRDST